MRSRPERLPWLMIAVMVAVTVWSCVDGKQGPAMMVVASVGTVAVMMLLETIAGALPRTRLVNAVFAGAWILLFMPAWDWLEGQFLFPESLWVALLFGAGFSLFRYFVSPPDGPARPPG